jgi:hypothetical protein
LAHRLWSRADAAAGRIALQAIGSGIPVAVLFTSAYAAHQTQAHGAPQDYLSSAYSIELIAFCQTRERRKGDKIPSLAPSGRGWLEPRQLAF